tara:strand:+ start:9710 stop:10048 length:339 start_codon:yes stop_codon:yes gene_type:complete
MSDAPERIWVGIKNTCIISLFEDERNEPHIHEYTLKSSADKTVNELCASNNTLMNTCHDLEDKLQKADKREQIRRDQVCELYDRIFELENRIKELEMLLGVEQRARIDGREY